MLYLEMSSAIKQRNKQKILIFKRQIIFIYNVCLYLSFRGIKNNFNFEGCFRLLNITDIIKYGSNVFES